MSEQGRRAGRQERGGIELDNWRGQNQAEGVLLAIALGGIGIGLVLGIVSLFLPDIIARPLFIAMNFLVAASTNYSYYLEQVKGKAIWNPFEGMF